MSLDACRGNRRDPSPRRAPRLSRRRDWAPATVLEQLESGDVRVRGPAGEADVERRQLRRKGQAQKEGIDLGELVDAACDARGGAILPAMVVEVYRRRR